MDAKIDAAAPARLLPRHVFVLLLGQMLVSLVLGVAVVLIWPSLQLTPQFIIVLEVTALLLPAFLLLYFYHLRPRDVLPLARPAPAAVGGTFLLVLGLTVLLNVANHIGFVYLPTAIQNFNPMAGLLDNLQLDSALDWGLFILAMAIVPA